MFHAATHSESRSCAGTSTAALRHLTVVTSNPDQGHPADPVWQPIGDTRCLALTDLPHKSEQWPPNNLIYDVGPRAPHPI